MSLFLSWMAKAPPPLSEKSETQGNLLNPKIKELYERALLGQHFAISRLVTLLENKHPDWMDVLACTKFKVNSRAATVVGITGPPGAGKSTMTDQLVALLRSEGKSVAVMAVDPSSPFSGGAILGDRVRMLRHSLDNNVFIRSLGTRGRHGGLSACTFNVVQLIRSLPFDVILVETVGVGQTELDIMTVADVTVVVLVPESGDGIQVMKSGLMEVGDIYVVNKADRPNSDLLYRDLQLSFHEEHKDKGLLKTSASKGEGIDKLWQEIQARTSCASDQKMETRVKFHLRHLLTETLQEKFEAIWSDNSLVAQILSHIQQNQQTIQDASLQLEKQLFVPGIRPK